MRTAQGLNGGVIRLPSHGRHSPQPLLDAAGQLLRVLGPQAEVRVL